MYESLLNLFTIKNISQVSILKYDLRTTHMTQEDTVESFFVKIERIRNDLLAIDEIFPDKELVITTLLGFPPTWGAFATGLNNWKVPTTFEELWTSYSQEVLRIH